MNVFVDTSAFLAILNNQDPEHKRAAKIWLELLDQGIRLISTNYVLLETVSLVQNRHGLEAVRNLRASMEPVLNIEWVDEETHQQGMSSVLTANRRGLGLVDCTSFVVLNRLGLRDVFAFDRHFIEQGFNCLPQPAV